MKNNFSNLIRMQEQLARAMLPLVQFQKQYSMIMKSNYSQIFSLQDSVNAAIETINRTQTIQLNAIREAARVSQLNLETLKPTLEYLSKLSEFSVAVPQTVVPQINDLYEIAESFLEDIEDGDLEEIEIANEEDVPATFTDAWTWDRLLILLLTIFQAIFPVITYTLDQIDAEKNEVIQSEQHDEIIEKFNELIQAIQPLIPEHDSEEDLQVPDSPGQ